jgi:hypothetical protein
LTRDVGSCSGAPAQFSAAQNTKEHTEWQVLGVLEGEIVGPGWIGYAEPALPMLGELGALMITHAWTATGTCDTLAFAESVSVYSTASSEQEQGSRCAHAVTVDLQLAFTSTVRSPRINIEFLE